MKLRWLILGVGIASTSLAQSAKLPDAPSSVHETVKPFTVGFGITNRITLVTSNPAADGKPAVNFHAIDDVYPTAFFNYRFQQNRFNLSTSLGYISRTGNYSVVTSLGVNMFRFGKSK